MSKPGISAIKINNTKQDHNILQSLSLNQEGQAESLHAKTPIQHNQLEKDILEILRQSRFADLNQIYKNFYAQSNNPIEVQSLFQKSDIANNANHDTTAWDLG